MKKVKRIISDILLIIFLGLAIYFFYQGYKQWKGYEDANKTYQKITEEVARNSKDGNGKWLKLNWKKLQKMTPDLIGWIYMDSGANYPILKGKTNKTYLHTDPYGHYSFNGCIFMNAGNNWNKEAPLGKNFVDKNTIIYGHNMNNGSMFGNNDKYKDDAYANKHKNFWIFTPKGRYWFKIYQTHVVYDETTIFKTDFKDENEFSGWLGKLGQNPFSKIGKQANKHDKVVSLSTCTQHGQKRFVIQGYQKEFETYDHKKKLTREQLNGTSDKIGTTDMEESENLIRVD